MKAQKTIIFDYYELQLTRNTLIIRTTVPVSRLQAIYYRVMSMLILFFSHIKRKEIIYIETQIGIYYKIQ